MINVVEEPLSLHVRFECSDIFLKTVNESTIPFHQ